MILSWYVIAMQILWIWAFVTYACVTILAVWVYIRAKIHHKDFITEVVDMTRKMIND